MEVVVIGRGHSGTRILTHLHQSNGFRTGMVNESGDFLGKSGRHGKHLLNMFEACRLPGKLVKYEGNHKWCFSRLLYEDINQSFINTLMDYVRPVIRCKDLENSLTLLELELRFPWLAKLLPTNTRRESASFLKLPELTLTLPWLTRLLPDVYFISLLSG